MCNKEPLTLSWQGYNYVHQGRGGGGLAMVYVDLLATLKNLYLDPSHNSVTSEIKVLFLSLICPCLKNGSVYFNMDKS